MVQIISKIQGIDNSTKYVLKDSENHLFESIIFSLAREPGKSISPHLAKSRSKYDE